MEMKYIGYALVAFILMGQVGVGPEQLLSKDGREQIEEKLKSTNDKESNGLDLSKIFSSPSSEDNESNQKKLDNKKSLDFSTFTSSESEGLDLGAILGSFKKPSSSKSYNFLISSTRMNVVYSGEMNPITVMAEGFESSDLVVECDGGLLQEDNSRLGKYSVLPDEDKNRLMVNVYLKQEGKPLKKIGSTGFRIIHASSY